MNDDTAAKPLGIKTFGAEVVKGRSRGPTNSCRLLLTDGDLEVSWYHCSVTSDFLGEFFADASGLADAELNEARHSIGYLVNELLENAVKFRAAGDIEINARLDSGTFELSVNNMVPEAVALRFQGLLEEITDRDPGDLLIEKIEANASDPDSGASGLGLLTLMNDYGVTLGWNFISAAEAGPLRLETHAALPIR